MKGFAVISATTIAKPFIKGYRFRLYPSTEQKVLLEKTFGCARFVWNHLLDQANKTYQAYKANPGLIKPSISGYGFINQLPALKAQSDHIWLNEVSSVALQQKLLDLGKAYSNFFGKKKVQSGYPKFKSKKHPQSFRLVANAFQLKDKQLTIAKSITPIKVKWSRELPSLPSSCTVTRTPSGKYFVSFVCEYQPIKTSGTGIIGIDAGITELATLSNGIAIANLRHYVKAQCRLTTLQRRLSKKQKGSHNRNKARLKVAKLHEHISNQRNNYLHKLTTRLIRENQAIAIESLQVSNMAKNHKLAKHILDAAWGKMREQLKYKAINSQHCKLILADPYYPSTQLCSCCGVKPQEKIKLGVLSWTCSHCGSVHQRDHNAAKNLELLAHKELYASAVIGLYPAHSVSIILTPSYTPHC